MRSPLAATPLPPLWRHLGVAVAWLLSYRLLADYGVLLLPASVANRLTLPEYLAAVAVLATTLGTSASFLFLRDARVALGVTGPRARSVAYALLLSTPVYVVVSAAAIAVALPTLLAEIRDIGRQGVQQQSGELGLAVAQSSTLTVLVWAGAISPIAEELLFRGALWSLVQRVVQRLAAEPPSAPSQALPSGMLRPSFVLTALGAGRDFLLRGGIATLLAAVVFAAMHADTPGGMGIVRVGSAFGLGLAAGLARQAAGSLWAPLALHVGFNTLSLAASRRWVVTEAFPTKLGIPTSLMVVGATCLLVALGLRLARWHAQRGEAERDRAPSSQS